MKKLNPLPILITFIFLMSFSSSSAQEEYTRWKLPQGAIARFGKGSMRELVYFPDGTRLAVRSSIGIWVYDARTGEELDLLTDDKWDVDVMAFSPDGKTFAVASDSIIRLLDLDTMDQKDVLAGHTRQVYALAFSPIEETLASGGNDGSSCWHIHVMEKCWQVQGVEKTIRFTYGTYTPENC